MKTKDFVIVTVLFYFGWFGSVLLARTDFSIASLLFPLLLFGFFYFKKDFGLKDCIFVTGVSIVGCLFDFLLIHWGFITISGQSAFLVPVWLLSIWFLFSLSMVKLGPRLHPPILLAALLGGIMGPLSYKSGEYFQVLSVTDSRTFLIYAVFWALAFPLILSLSRRLE